MEKKKKKGRLLSNIFFVLMFVVGLGVLIYPRISDLYYKMEASEQITAFESGKSKMDDEEIKRRMGLAFAYNDALVKGNLSDPFDSERFEEGVAEYARMLEVHEQIGHVNIPKLSLDIPIYAGTAEVVLQKGIGHLEGTSLPVGGNSTHAVITGHRGLPTAKLFTDLDKLVIGDKFYIHNIGEIIAYQVDQVLVIEPTDFSELLIAPGHDYVTLLTCTPYMVNSHRLIVRGHRVDYVPAVAEREIQENNASNRYRDLFYGTLAVLILLILFNVRRALKEKKQRKKREAEEKLLQSQGGTPEKERRNSDE